MIIDENISQLFYSLKHRTVVLSCGESEVKKRMMVAGLLPLSKRIKFSLFKSKRFEMMVDSVPKIFNKKEIADIIKKESEGLVIGNSFDEKEVTA